jgi:peroxiredoxin
LRRHYDEIQAAGAQVVALGTGNADYANAFIEEQKIPFPVLIDAEAEAAKIASVKRGKRGDLIGPKQLIGGTKAFFKGHRQKFVGDRRAQLGATFVIAPGGKLLYEHRAEGAEEHAPLKEVLKAAGAS